MAVTRLSGGLTPADGSDPRTFPAIWNNTATQIEQAQTDITSLTADVVVLSQGYVYVGSRYYTSSGSFFKANPLLTGDIGLSAVRVRLVGGGGGGSGSPATGAGQGHCGASGSGAAYAESFLTDMSALGNSETVTVGAGGPGGASGGNGTNGGTSSFGSFVSANGGQGGFAQGVSGTTTGYPGVSGQSIATGDLIITGGASNLGICAPTAFSIAANGGSSALGGGAQGLEQFGSGGKNGQDAEGWGGGGSGSVNGPSSAARDGGDGKAGIVIVDCFVRPT